MEHAKGRETESSAVYNTGIRWGTTSQTNGATSEKRVTSQMKSLQPHNTKSVWRCCSFLGKQFWDITWPPRVLITDCVQ